MFESNATAVLDSIDRSQDVPAGSHIVTTLHAEEELVQAHRLRHLVFAEQLHWVPCTENGLEYDPYDAFAVHFGVLDDRGKLLAYVRLITADRPFMIEKEFLVVLGEDHPIRKEEDTCELTRFCVTPEARNIRIACRDGESDVVMLLFKGVYAWCCERDIRFIYGITDRTIHKFLNIKGFPYRIIGAPKVMPDGVVARAIFLDWREFEHLNAVKRPGLLEWYGYSSMSLVPRAMASA